MMSKHTITLDYPVTFGGETVSSLSFRRPKVRDIRRLATADGGDADRSIKMMADLCEREVDLLDEMDPVDFAKINAWLEPILDPQAQPVRSNS